MERWIACWFAIGLAGCSASAPAGAGSSDDSDGTSTPSSTSSSESNTSSAGDTTSSQGPAAPATPRLLSPSNGAVDVAIETELCWEPSEDPNRDVVRYTVILDGIELENGKGEQPGHPGPCLGPLAFNHDQTYEWTVEAFEADDPTSRSAPASPWKFTTASDGQTKVVFQDTFDDDNGWTNEGDALSGEWVRGNPVMTLVDGNATLAQPDDCAGGGSCYFTGQNPDAIPSEADVSGGSAVLLSPPFDLFGYATATVTLSRFFYKSDAIETGTLFRVELLIPDADAPDGYTGHVLEQLEHEEDVDGANMWTPVEFSACSLPMVDGTRLRITATDLGDGIVEAALDSVTVTGQHTDKVCTGGVGSICDPETTDACATDLSCCPQGVVNTGVYRCSEPVAGLDYGNPPLDRDAPFNGPPGCDAPDLFVEGTDINLAVDTIFVSNEPNNQTYCLLLEECVDGPGQRTVLRFDTRTPNIGSKDLTMGVPSNHPDLFHWSSCHDHNHFDGYAAYRLLDGDGNEVAKGHKQAFCLLDFEPWAWQDADETYTCSNQGISAGWMDIYGGHLPCQWIDITDVPPGNYVLEISVNPPRADTSVSPLVERDYTNNVLQIAVEI